MKGISSYFDVVFFLFSISCKATVKRYKFSKAFETDTTRHIMKSAFLLMGAVMKP
jgi:hypothetical protein